MGSGHWFETLDEMQAALDAHLVTYNTERPHQGRGLNGHAPWRAFIYRTPTNDNFKEDTDRQTDAA